MTRGSRWKVLVTLCLVLIGTLLLLHTERPNVEINWLNNASVIKENRESLIDSERDEIHVGAAEAAANAAMIAARAAESAAESANKLLAALASVTRNTRNLTDQPMRSEELIALVRASLVPPSTGLYHLEKPKKTFFAQEKQDKLIAKIFKNMTGGVFLEAGALDGEYLSNTLYLERELGWTGVLVEPSSLSFEKMQSKNRKCQLLKACLSPSQKAEELKLVIQSKDPALFKLADNKGVSSMKSALVPCYPLFTVLSAINNPTVDVLSLDLEGVELKVLQTIPWDEVKIRVILVEVNHITKGLSLVQSYLRSKGYKFIQKIGVDLVFYNPNLSAGLVIS